MASVLPVFHLAWSGLVGLLENDSEWAYEFLLLIIPIASINYFIRAIRWSIFVNSERKDTHPVLSSRANHGGLSWVMPICLPALENYSGLPF